ncbi:MAG: transposase [Chloroflexi bacterium]|nr:transposase [Chloroflexota bacterium]
MPFISKHTLTADFQGGQLTSDAGLLLLRQAETKVSLIKAMAYAIHDPRHPSRINLAPPMNCGHLS